MKQWLVARGQLPVKVTTAALICCYWPLATDH